MNALNHEERILTLHPEGKKGVRILKSRYDLMYNTLLSIFAEYPEISHKEMTRLSAERVTGLLEGSIPWLMETVKLDMLARGIIEKTSGNPVKLRIVTR
jgi:hypothetical protein